MSMRRFLLRLLVAAFFLNASGLAFSADQFAAGIAHDMEFVSATEPGADSGKPLDACKHKCQGHYAEHFTVLPSEFSATLALVSPVLSLPELVSRPPSGSTSSLFRPPRTHSL